MAAFLAAVATVIASIGGLFYNAQTVRQATAQAQLADRAQAAERFSRSVEQLGSASEPVRIGAVYAFGALMRDSSEDRFSIVEILSDFVRMRARQEGRLGEGRDRRAPADVLAALGVLDAQPRPRRQVTASGAVLTWPSMMLTRIELRRVSLRETSMREADLELAHFSDVDFFSTDLTGSDLRSTSWVNPSLTAAILVGADLTSANLYKGDLIEADLRRAQLYCTGLVRSSLEGADLRGADMRGTMLNRANLQDTDLSNAVLVGADLRGANLTGADLRGTDLRDADLRGADVDDIITSPTTHMPASPARVRDCG